MMAKPFDINHMLPSSPHGAMKTEMPKLLSLSGLKAFNDATTATSMLDRFLYDTDLWTDRLVQYGIACECQETALKKVEWRRFTHRSQSPKPNKYGYPSTLSLELGLESLLPRPVAHEVVKSAAEIRKSLDMTLSKTHENAATG